MTPEIKPVSDALVARYAEAGVRRPCGSCTACCDTLEIPEIAKPFGEKCPNSCGGCAIYSARPQSCRNFRCAWVMGYGRRRDRPDKSGALAEYKDGHFGLQLYGMIVELAKRDRALETLGRLSDEAGTDVLVVD